MKLVIIEPLGVEKDKLLSIARNALKDSVEIIYYDTKTTDTQELIERGKDAEIIVVANAKSVHARFDNYLPSTDTRTRVLFHRLLLT